MSATIEIHGRSRCPFAFRTRIAAAEKGVSFDWLPFDAPDRDPRTATNNPDNRSPLMWHAGFALTDSAVINQYIDEAFEGPALQPTEPKQRAQMRLTMLELAALKVDGRMELTEEARTTAEAALQTLDGKLATGASWLGGETPSLADIEIWTYLTILRMKGLMEPEKLSRLARVPSYWDRVQQRTSYRETNPYQA